MPESVSWNVISLNFSGLNCRIGRITWEVFVGGLRGKTNVEAHSTVHSIWGEKMKVLVTQSCPALCDPMGCSPPSSSVYGILQARIWEWIAIPFSRESSWLQSMGSQRVGDNWAHVYVCVCISFSESVQLLSRVWLFVTSWDAACQASLSITNSQSLLKLMCIELVMPSNHLILCHPLLLSPSMFPSIRVFSNESVLSIRGPKYWSFSSSINPSNEYSGLISFRMDWLNSPCNFLALNIQWQFRFLWFSPFSLLIWSQIYTYS